MYLSTNRFDSIGNQHLRPIATLTHAQTLKSTLIIMQYAETWYAQYQTTVRFGCSSWGSTTQPLKANKKPEGDCQSNHESSIPGLDLEMPETRFKNFLHGHNLYVPHARLTQAKTPGNKKTSVQTKSQCIQLQRLHFGPGPQSFDGQKSISKWLWLPPGSGNSVAAHVDTKRPMAAGALDAYHDASGKSIWSISMGYERTLPKEVGKWFSFFILAGSWSVGDPNCEW